MKLYPSEIWRPSPKGRSGAGGSAMKTIGRPRRNGIAVGGSAPKKPTPGVSLDLAEELKRQESPRLPSKPTHPDLEPPSFLFSKGRAEGEREDQQRIPRARPVSDDLH